MCHETWILPQEDFDEMVAACELAEQQARDGTLVIPPALRKLADDFRADVAAGRIVINTKPWNPGAGS